MKISSLVLQRFVPSCATQVLLCMALFAGELCSSMAAEKRGDKKVWKKEMAAAKEALSKTNLDKAEAHYIAALAQAQLFEDSDVKKAQTYAEVGDFTKNRMNYKKSVQFYKEAIRVTTVRVGTNHVANAGLHLALGGSHSYLEEWQKARPCYLEAERLLERALTGKASPARAYPLLGLATIAAGEKKFDEAQKHLAKAYDMAKFQPHHIELDSQMNMSVYRVRSDDSLLSTIRNQIGMVYLEQEKYAEALKVFEEVLADGEREYGKKALALHAPLHNIALVYRKQEKWAEAVPFLLRCQALEERGEGAYPHVLNTYASLMDVHYQMDNPTEAAAYLKKFYLTQKQRKGSPQALTPFLSKITKADFTEGRTEKALAIYLKTIQVQEEVYGKEAPELQEMLAILGRIYDWMGEKTTGAAYANRANAVKKK